MVSEMNRKMRKQGECPVQIITEKYGLDEDSLMGIVRLNWRMAIIGILGKIDGKTANYNTISRITGLNPRMLSIVLKELTKEKLVSRVAIEGKPTFRAYRLTTAGMEIAGAQCPILSIAKGRPSRRHGQL